MKKKNTFTTRKGDGVCIWEIYDKATEERKTSKDVNRIDDAVHGGMCNVI